MDNAIIENSKLLAEYLGYIYIPSTAELKAGWYKPGFSKGAYKIDGKFYTHICRNHHQLRFYNSYDWLFEVVEKVEKEDLKEFYYSWVEDGEINYNFECLSINRYDSKRWVSSVSLSLDPEVIFFSDYGDKISDKQSLFDCLVGTIKEINKVKNG